MTGTDWVWSKWLEAEIERRFAYIRSPEYLKYLEESRTAWLAKPWHERARVRLKSKIHALRTKLGEIIAGREFDE